jgi:hypothetical protein
MSGITPQEKRSLTHGDFWIPDAERNVYQRALGALNGAGVPYVVAGAYAIYEHTGIYRETKDLDVFVEPEHVIATMSVLKDAGFTARLEQPHWLAKAICGKPFVDIIFGMGNGLALIDQAWYSHSRPAILAATPVRVAPPEELLWHRLFIGERHRQDLADIAHLIVCVGSAMDWRRLVDRTGEHWPLLLAQLQIFNYVYPEFAGAVPEWVSMELLARARDDVGRQRTTERVTRGTMISRFSFAIDVNEWGFRDLREEYVRRTSSLPVVRQIATSNVWDERSKPAREYESKHG